MTFDAAQREQKCCELAERVEEVMIIHQQHVTISPIKADIMFMH